MYILSFKFPSHESGALQEGAPAAVLSGTNVGQSIVTDTLSDRSAETCLSHLMQAEYLEYPRF